MWDSNGDILNATVQRTDSGDMVVSGKIDQNASVVLISTDGSITVNDKIDGGSFALLVSTGGSINVNGKIDGASRVILIATKGSITVAGKIDGNSSASLRASGNVSIGTQGGEGDQKIDGDSQVDVIAGGDIVIGSYVHKATIDFLAHGHTSMTEIDYGARVRQLADGDVLVAGKIDGSSRVELVSNRGSVKIDGKIDGNSKVYLTAGRNVSIGLGPNGGDDDRKIDGNSSVTAIAGGSISLGGAIHKDHTAVDFAAEQSVIIGKDISGGPTVRLLSAVGKITVTNGISDSNTSVTSFPQGALVTQINGGATFIESEWVSLQTLLLAPARAGYWWENWPQTFGYVSSFRVVPRTVDEISGAITGHATAVKAIGGGWSFSDAALPFKTQHEVDNASILLRGGWQRQDLRDILEGVDDWHPNAMDLLPQAVGRNFNFSTTYDQSNLRQVTASGAQLPPTRSDVRLVDTRSLASSLNCEFSAIHYADEPKKELLFHVEAGITMADLQQLLDHQYPRLALRASGGSPGATLAGALSTATHGGEFAFPLLVDTVRAIHLVGPGGEQWWIEGDIRIADQQKLQQRYPKLDPAHFIGGPAWNGIPGLTPQDVLNAVTVSMGTMGVIYSVVLSVVPQFGLNQAVHPTSWAGMLSAANVSEQALQSGDAQANKALLDFLMDGSVNGTGIPKAKNIYIDLAVNPINRDCWVVNRQITPRLPDDSNTPSPGLGDYMTALSQSLARNAVDMVQHSKLAGRIFDFLSWATDIPSINIIDDINDASQAGRLMSFITNSGDALGSTLAALAGQAFINTNTVIKLTHPDRGHLFVGDVLSGFFHAMEGTAPGVNSDRTGLSYKVGAIGWPDGGLPGRALEVALDSTNAFTFLQKVLFDDVLTNTMVNLGNPFIGYISLRVCPPTQTLMGMQQYAPFSVMVEVVAYRSPQANEIMDQIQTKALSFSTPGPKPLVHWGLENNQLTKAYLATTPLGQKYKNTNLSRLEVFRKVREFFKNGHAPVFDNNFASRLGL